MDLPHKEPGVDRTWAPLVSFCSICCKKWVPEKAPRHSLAVRQATFKWEQYLVHNSWKRSRCSRISFYFLAEVVFERFGLVFWVLQELTSGGHEAQGSCSPRQLLLAEVSWTTLHSSHLCPRQSELQPPLWCWGGGKAGIAPQKGTLTAGGGWMTFQNQGNTPRPNTPPPRNTTAGRHLHHYAAEVLCPTPCCHDPGTQPGKGTGAWPLPPSTWPL